MGRVDPEEGRHAIGAACVVVAACCVEPEQVHRMPRLAIQTEPADPTEHALGDFVLEDAHGVTAEIEGHRAVQDDGIVDAVGLDGQTEHARLGRRQSNSVAVGWIDHRHAGHRRQVVCGGRVRRECGDIVRVGNLNDVEFIPRAEAWVHRLKIEAHDHVHRVNEMALKLVLGRQDRTAKGLGDPSAIVVLESQAAARGGDDLRHIQLSGRPVLGRRV